MTFSPFMAASNSHFIGFPLYWILNLPQCYPLLNIYPNFTLFFSTMETLVSLPFRVLEIPPMRLKKPAFLALPSAMMVFGLVMISYFLVLGGVIYDIIIEPPSIGQVNIQSELVILVT